MKQYLEPIHDGDLREIASYVKRKYRGPQLETLAKEPPMTPLMMATLYGNKAVAEALLSSVNAATSIEHVLGKINALDLGKLCCVQTVDEYYSKLIVCCRTYDMQNTPTR